MKLTMTLLLPVLLLSHVKVYAQDTIKVVKDGIVHQTVDPVMPWDTLALGKRFAMSGSYRSVDGKVLDFAHPQRPSFVCFGFYGCHPCERQLPFFIELSEAYPGVDFVYVTFDSEETRGREFKEAGRPDFKPGSNYYIVRMDRKDIDKKGLSNGYPHRYFIDATGIVKYVGWGGYTSELPGDFKERMGRIIKRG